MKTSPRIRFTPLSENDLTHVMGWVNDREVMGYFAGHSEPISEDAELRFMRELIASPTDRAFSAWDEETGEYVGQASINKIYWPSRNGRIFLTLTRSAQGRRYAPALLDAIVRKGWELGLHKLWLIVREDNLSSRAAYEKAGFRVEGVLPDEYFVQGRFYDMVRMSRINPNETKGASSTV